MTSLCTTHWNERTGTLADVSVSVLLIALGVRRHDFGAIGTALWVLYGVLLFTLVEYGFHRWIFHGPASVLQRGHARHHQHPTGHDALPFFVPALSLLMLAAAFTMILPAAPVLLSIGGLASGYAAYGIAHMRIHRYAFTTPLLRRWAAAHHVHHRHPERNFGVTSPLWDRLLKTRYRSQARRSD